MDKNDNKERLARGMQSLLDLITLHQKAEMVVKHGKFFNSDTGEFEDDDFNPDDFVDETRDEMIRMHELTLQVWREIFDDTSKQLKEIQGGADRLHHPEN